VSNISPGIGEPGAQGSASVFFASLKMMETGVFVFFLMLLLASASAQAESLTWEQSLAEARDNNPELRAAEFSLQGAEFDERGSYQNFFPQVSGAVSYAHTDADMAGNTGTVSGDSYGLSLNANQNLFNGLADLAKVDQAKAAKEKSKEAFRAAFARISADLKNAFANMRYAQEYQKLADQIVTRRRDNLSLVDLRFDHGSENKGSVLLSRANLEQAKLEAMQAKNALEVARSDFARVLGRDNADGIEVKGSVPLQSPKKDEAISLTASRTPAYLQSKASEKSADAGLSLAQSGFFPTLGLTGSVGKNDTQWFPQQNRWTIGATLTIPIFSGGSTYYGAKSAAKASEAAAKTAENTYRSEVNKLTSSYSAYEIAVQKLEVDKTFAEAAAV
jgi:outer membrane protein TolC